jgi:hypothetical protein
MSSVGAAPRAVVQISSARAEASRRNGAKSRGPKTPESKACAAQNALKHGLRAQKYVVLPDEDAAGFAALEAAMVAELAPVGALQVVLARRVATAAWRLSRADRIEVELFEQRRWDHGDVGLALIRDGNGTRSFETLMRYRGAAMAEFMRALRTLKALQAEHAAGAQVLEMPPRQPRAPARLASRPAPNEPERRPEPAPERRLEYVLPATLASGQTLHEPAAPWAPNEPEPERRPEPAPERRPECVLPATLAPGQTLHEPAAPWTPNEPEPDAVQVSKASGATASTRSGDACAPGIPRVAWTA